MPALDTPPPRAERPRFPEELRDVEHDLDAVFTATPMYATLGITLQDWGPGWAQLGLSPTAAMLNLAGSVHGGAIFTLADAAFEIACNSYGRVAVALETTCHYHRPAVTGALLTGDAWEISRGNRTASYRLQVCNSDDEVVASYLALAYRTSRWHVDATRLPDGWG